MRNLFLILLLANLVYFGWQYTRTPAPEPGVTVVDPDRAGPSIPLVGEMEADGGDDPRPAPADREDGAPTGGSGDQGDAGVAPTTGALGAERTASQADNGAKSAAEAPVSGTEPGPDGDDIVVAMAGRTASDNATACVSVGPFTDGEAAAAAFAAAEGRGLAAGRRTLRDDVFAGHWVQVTNIPTREQANALIAKLKEAGLSDAYLLRGQPGDAAISLGLFSDISGAERIRARAAGAGIEPVIQETYRERTVHWVDASGARSTDASALAARFGADKVLVGDAARCPGAG